MGLQLCRESGPFDFRDSCVRRSWTALAPVALVFALCIVSLPVPGPARWIIGVLKSPFNTYLTLHEAEALAASAAPSDKVNEDISYSNETLVAVPLWRTVVLSWISLLQTLVWLGVGSFLLMDERTAVWAAICPMLVAASWLYATARPVLRPTATPPYDLFCLFIIQLISAILLLGGVLFDHNASGSPLPPTFVILGLVANLVAVLVLVVVVINMPVGVPSEHVKKEEIVNVLSCI